jgi:hypothetical protein
MKGTLARARNSKSVTLSTLSVTSKGSSSASHTAPATQQAAGMPRLSSLGLDEALLGKLAALQVIFDHCRMNPSCA